jgi:23S rRNA (cytosine1962-C5)-methyltransferase
MIKVILKRGRERSIVRRHPWIFSGAIAQVGGTPESGETVEVCASDGTSLARGAYSARSQLSVRIWTFQPQEEIDPSFFRGRLEAAAEMRRRLMGDAATACRLVYAESDGLPGIIVDRYDRTLVCQFLTAGAERWKSEIVRQLAALFPGLSIYERSDADSREKEGLPPAKGALAGDPPEGPVTIGEGNFRFFVDIAEGHKTGFYLDQRDSRICVAALSRGAEVLNCFSYTGGFAVAAMKGGAKSVTNVESSGPALKLGRRNLELNGLDPSAVEDMEGDVFTVLRGFRDRARSFDLIILDPPKFADTKGHLMRAARGYKDINLLAFKLLRPGGLLVTFSCSGLLSRDLFQKIVADAAEDAGRVGQIVRQLSQPADHPVRLSFPEGAYLKGLVCRVE